MKQVTTGILIGLLLTVAAQAAPPSQWFSPSGGEPVDQAVGDLDPLGTSLRRVHAGLRTDGEHTSMFRVEAAPNFDRPLSPGATYYRVAPGLRARVTKQDYLVPLGEKHVGLNIASKYDGVFYEVASAGSVYDLRTTAVTPQQANFGPDHRINARLDGRIEGRVDGRTSK